MLSKCITFILGYFSPHGASAPNGAGPPHYRGFTITLRHTTLGRIPLDERSARRRDLCFTPHNSYTRQTSMAPGGIRTHTTGRRAVVDPHLRPRGLWNRYFGYLVGKFDGFSGLVVSILATGTRVRGFKPGRSRWIFRASEKSSVCLRRGNKIICPMSQLCGM
jgi:hypothetical protein